MEVKPLQALLVAAVFIVLVALAAYSGTQARMLQGPTDLRLDRAGQLHLRIGQKIFVYDEQFRLAYDYTLDRFGVEGLLGSYDFFSDNSLLLAAEQVSAESPATRGRLLRCAADAGGCRPLPQAEHRFERSFRVAIDSGDDVFLADSLEGAVYWLDAEGLPRDTLSRALDRPHQLRLIDGQLVIAHTEGEELLRVPLDGGAFAPEQDWQRIALRSAANQSRRETRPLDFLRVGQDWVVLAKTRDMRSGAVYRYDDSGAYQSHFTLPRGSDPFALAYLGGDILVADYASLQVYRYSTDGARLDNLDSPAQTAFIADLQQRQRNFSLLGYASWGLFILALVIGFAVAIRGELRKVKQKREQDPQGESQAPAAGPTPRPHVMDARIYWLSPKKTPLWLGLLALGLTVPLPLMIGIGLPETEDPKKLCSRYSLEIMMWGFTGLMLLIFVPVMIKLRTTLSTRIGLCDEWVLVDHGNGTVRAARDKDLIKVANGFIIDNVTIPTVNSQRSLYDRKALQQRLQPRLDRGASLGPIQQITWQWHNRRGLLLVSVAGVAAGLLVVVAMETGWFEERFERWVQKQPACWDADAVQGSPDVFSRTDS